LVIHVFILALSFVVILAGSELFTNGIEWVGHRLKIAEAAVGSLLAAVGTALPETLIPAIALLSGGRDHASRSAVGIGAIVGAPLMLSTLAFFVMGVAAIGFRKRRGRVALRINRHDVRRDLMFFVPLFLGLALMGLGSFGLAARRTVVLLLLSTYGVYSVMLLRLKRDPEASLDHGLYFERLFRGDPSSPRLGLILFQVVVGLLAITVGATWFVDQIVLFSNHAGLNPGLLSLILSPLATELPEKYNSVVWIRQSKDHLALANITGAMVFQSCVPTALGLAFSPWHLSPAELLACAIGIGSAILLYINVRDDEIGTPTLMIGGGGYVVFIVGVAMLEIF
jgi:cation:H+ antiporter